MKWTVGTKIGGGFAIAVVFIVLLGVLVYNTTKVNMEDVKWVVHGNNVIDQVNEIMLALKDAETGQRGFIITGEDRYLEPYREALKIIEEHIKDVRGLTKDNPNQQKRLDSIAPLINEKVAELKETIDLRKNKGFAEALKMVITDKGKTIMDNIRKLDEEILKEEYDLLKKRDTAMSESSKKLIGLITYGVPLVAVLIIVVAFFLSKNISVPLKAMTEVAVSIANGDVSINVKPLQRGDEVAVLSVSMKSIIDSLRGLVGEATMLTKAAVEGKLSTRADASRHQGDFRKIVQGINDTLDAVIGPLNVAAGYVERIAKGDIPQPITGKYNGDFEVFINNLNNMNTGLRDMLGNLQEAVNVLASSTNQILAGTAEMSTSATETATSVSETTTTMEEVKQTAKQMSHNATVVSETAQGTAQLSELGKKSVEDTISVMGKIKEQVDFVANNIVKLSEQSQAIGAIISSVNDLSNQSNLLAVNASIEAAKAGEQGKGFAVVAQEVRSLAEQSKEATNQVRTILNDIQKAISGAVMATEQSAKAVEAGMNQSQTAGDSIGKMTEGIMKSVQTAIQIAASTNEQVAGIEQVASAMENIKKATEQIALSTRQSQESAKNMHELGAKLKQMVEKYKV